MHNILDKKIYQNLSMQEIEHSKWPISFQEIKKVINESINKKNTKTR
jgi:hypothetical protein